MSEVLYIRLRSWVRNYRNIRDRNTIGIERNFVNYLKALRATAFFSGRIPTADIEHVQRNFHRCSEQIEKINSWNRGRETDGAILRRNIAESCPASGQNVICCFCERCTVVFELLGDVENCRMLFDSLKRILQRQERISLQILNEVLTVAL